MGGKKLVFVTPLEDGSVEVDTNELCEAGWPPFRIEGGLGAAALFVVGRYPERRPVLLLERDAGSPEADAQLGAFEQARAAALASWPCGISVPVDVGGGR